MPAYTQPIGAWLPVSLLPDFVRKAILAPEFLHPLVRTGNVGGHKAAAVTDLASVRLNLLSRASRPGNSSWPSTTALCCAHTRRAAWTLAALCYRGPLCRRGKIRLKVVPLSAFRSTVISPLC